MTYVTLQVEVIVGLKEVQIHEQWSKREMSFVETFFNWHDAVTWIEGHLADFDLDHWSVEQCSVNLMPNGSYRAGIVFAQRQKELF